MTKRRAVGVIDEAVFILEALDDRVLVPVICVVSLETLGVLKVATEILGGHRMAEKGVHCCRSV
jgi:hypothetical protein